MHAHAFPPIKFDPAEGRASHISLHLAIFIMAQTLAAAALAFTAPAAPLQQVRIEPQPSRRPCARVARGCFPAARTRIAH